MQAIAQENTFSNLLEEMEECGACGWAYRLRQLLDAHDIEYIANIDISEEE